MIVSDGEKRHTVHSFIFVIVASMLIWGNIGCSSKCPSGHPKKYDKPNTPSPTEIQSADSTLAMVRSTVLERLPDLSIDNQYVVLNSIPRISVYILAGSFGQFGWNWELPGRGTISVFYTGDITAMKKSDIKVSISKGK
jgi:hypothetical protein